MRASGRTSATRLASLVACGLVAGCEALAGYSSREPWPLDAEGGPIVSPYDDAATDAPVASDVADVLDPPDALVCPSGATLCSGACVDTTSDARNCGGCTRACRADEYCAGASKCVCRVGLTSCSFAGCVDVRSDPHNCGACGHRCDWKQVCSEGVCQSACSTTLVACATGWSGTACADLASDPLHCGACDTRCATGQECVAGACKDAAPAVGCATCPCAGCGAILGQAAVCCPALAGQAEPLCVAGGACK